MYITYLGRILGVDLKDVGKLPEASFPLSECVNKALCSVGEHGHGERGVWGRQPQFGFG